MVSQFNGTSTPKGSYRAKTGDNDCNVNSSRYSPRTALCESIRYQAKSGQNVRQDPIPRVRHGEAALQSREGKNADQKEQERSQEVGKTQQGLRDHGYSRGKGQKSKSMGETP